MKDNENPSDAGRSDPVCPECAAPVSQREVAVPWAVRHRRLVQAAVLLIALSYVVWRNIEAWPILPPPTVGAGVPFSAEFPRHRYSRTDLERYASGERADGRLISDLHNTDMVGNFELGVTFVSPSGDGQEFRRYGWPTDIAIYLYDATYDDVYAKTNPTATLSAFRNGWWWGQTYISKRIDSSGRREIFAFYLKALAVGPVMVLAAWGAGRLLRWIAFAIRIAQRHEKRVRDRLARRLPLLCVLACAIGVTVASLLPRFDPGVAFPIPWNPGASYPGLFAADIARLIQEPAGESILARRILDATSDVPSTSDACLVFGWRSDFGFSGTNASGGWPVGAVSHIVTEQEGVASAGKPAFSLNFRRTHVEIIARSSGDRQRIVRYRFPFDLAARLVLGLCAVWITTGFGVWVCGWTVRKRTTRRIERGWCVQCGYDLSGLRRDEDDSTQT